MRNIDMRFIQKVDFVGHVALSGVDPELRPTRDGQGQYFRVAVKMGHFGRPMIRAFFHDNDPLRATLTVEQAEELVRTQRDVSGEVEILDIQHGQKKVQRRDATGQLIDVLNRDGEVQYRSLTQVLRFKAESLRSCLAAYDLLDYMLLEEDGDSEPVEAEVPAGRSRITAQDDATKAAFANAEM